MEQIDGAEKIVVGMVALGCSKNQVDAEIMLGSLRKAGFLLSTNPAKCDVVIVNTCGFIESAKRESIESILEYCKMKESGLPRLVVVTGCLAERYREELAELIPEADVVLSIGANDELVSAIKKGLAGEKVRRFCAPENLQMSGSRVLANLPFFAYIRIADGCDNRCTYCAIPLIRGRFRSRPIEDILAEAEAFAAKGVKEFVVIAQDTTRYGEDLYGERRLPELLTKLCAIEDVKWVRVLYAYPERVTDELLEVMAREEKIVKYLDIPLQHVSSKILKAMNRRGGMAETTDLIHKIREKVPGIVLRTTLLTGFPGESDRDFELLCKFVKLAKFERLGCFAYSQEEGTPAALLPCQIDQETKDRRAEVIMQMQIEISALWCKKQIGKVFDVVVEDYDKVSHRYYGRSQYDAPDIDGRVYFKSGARHTFGEFVRVKIEKATEYDLFGSIESESGE